MYYFFKIYVFFTEKKNCQHTKRLTGKPISFRAHPKRQVSGQIHTGIFVLISNQSLSWTTLRGRGMGLRRVVACEVVVGGVEVSGRVGCSHITPHSDAGSFTGVDR